MDVKDPTYYRRVQAMGVVSILLTCKSGAYVHQVSNLCSILLDKIERNRIDIITMKKAKELILELEEQNLI